MDMFNYEYKVIFKTTSEHPCESCVRVAGSSPYFHISDSINPPSPQKFNYLRPHPNCSCSITVERTTSEVSGQSNTYYEVRNEREVLVGRESEPSMVRPAVNATNHEQVITFSDVEGESATRTQTIRGEISDSIRVGVEGSYGPSEFETSGSGTFSWVDNITDIFTSSSTQTSTSSYTLAPGEAGSIVEYEVTETWNILGDLYKIYTSPTTGQVHETFMGTQILGQRIEVTTSYGFENTEIGSEFSVD